MADQEISKFWTIVYASALSALIRANDSANARSTARTNAAAEADYAIRQMRLAERSSPGDEF